MRYRLLIRHLRTFRLLLAIAIVRCVILAENAAPFSRRIAAYTHQQKRKLREVIYCFTVVTITIPVERILQVALDSLRRGTLYSHVYSIPRNVFVVDTSILIAITYSPYLSL